VSPRLRASDCHLGQRRHGSARPQREQLARLRGEVASARSLGLGEDDIALLFSFGGSDGGGRDGSAPAARSLRTAPPSTRLGLYAGWPRPWNASG